MPNKPRSPEAKAARRIADNAARIARGASVPCGVEGCDGMFSDQRQVSRHKRVAHGFRRNDWGTIGKSESQSRNGFERVQKIAVRGRNADSAGFFERYGYALFGDRRAAA